MSTVALERSLKGCGPAVQSRRPLHNLSKRVVPSELKRILLDKYLLHEMPPLELRPMEEPHHCKARLPVS